MVEHKEEKRVWVIFRQVKLGMACDIQEWVERRTWGLTVRVRPWKTQEMGFQRGGGKGRKLCEDCDRKCLSSANRNV